MFKTGVSGYGMYSNLLGGTKKDRLVKAVFEFKKGVVIGNIVRFSE